MLAGIAAALWIDRPGVELVAAVADPHHPAAGEQMPVAGIARGHHTLPKSSKATTTLPYIVRCGFLVLKILTSKTM